MTGITRGDAGGSETQAVMPKPLRTRILAALLAGLLAFQLSACGTILYPERHGQRSGRVDPAVLLFDGALLILFVVPGLIAFGVDFHTGAVYLPNRSAGVTVVPLPEGERSAEAIERIVRQHTGLEVELSDARVEARVVAPERGLELALREAGTSLRAGGVDPGEGPGRS